MKNNHCINTILKLNKTIADRREFNKQSSLILTQMIKDQDFWTEVVKQNLTDKVYLSRNWTMYEIPFLYVFENDDSIVKIHLFVANK